MYVNQIQRARPYRITRAFQVNKHVKQVMVMMMLVRNQNKSSFLLVSTFISNNYRINKLPRGLNCSYSSSTLVIYALLHMNLTLLEVVRVLNGRS